MPVFETPGGSRRDITLPQTNWPELQGAVDAYATLKRELRATHARKSSLERDLEKIEQTATRALKDAIRQGKGEKEAVAKHDKELERVKHEIAACDRREKATNEALDEAESEIIMVVDDHRSDWLEDVAPQLDAALEEYRKTVEVLASQRDDVSRLYALRGWLRGFPEEVETFKVGRGLLPKLRNPNGAPHYVHDVLAALREDATPEPPREIQPFQPLIPRGQLLGNLDGIS
jgi:chaperonin cofactor prefoldin